MATKKAQSPYLTVAEILADLRIGRSTWQRWRALGRAPHCQKLPGGTLRVDRAVYEDWKASLKDDLFDAAG